MTKQIIYLTTNQDKAFEAQEYFINKHHLNIKIIRPTFTIIEIQAATCLEVVKLSVRCAADKLGQPVIKSDAGFYLDALGGLPGPYSTYFAQQIGTEKFLRLLKDEANRQARIEHCWAYCEPQQEPQVFSGGIEGTIAFTASGKSSHWIDKFFIPNGETETISCLRDRSYKLANKFWGDAKQQLVAWLKRNKKIGH